MCIFPSTVFGARPCVGETYYGAQNHFQLVFALNALTISNEKQVKMKLAIVASLIASAAAFAPAQTGKASTALNMAFEDELGAQPPLGLWDPFGMLNGADQERFDRLRYVEIKHGRICQLAFLGQIVTRASWKH
jgi:hypothetical protein